MKTKESTLNSKVEEITSFINHHDCLTVKVVIDESEYFYAARVTGWRNKSLKGIKKMKRKNFNHVRFIEKNFRMFMKKIPKEKAKKLEKTS